MFNKKPVNKMSISKRKLLFGVGVNDADYKVKPTVSGKRGFCAFYLRWACMLQRCYSDEYHVKYPSYKECYVCSEWLVFSNFKKWMESQDWKDKQLDKDIVITGNKVYSPSTCIFVSSEINYLVIDQENSRGNYARGVCLKAKTNKFIAQCNVGGKKVHIGSFDLEKEASDAYVKFKVKLILGIAKYQQSPLKEYLVRISKELTSEQIE